jgi:hypothetical protein
MIARARMQAVKVTPAHFARLLQLAISSIVDSLPLLCTLPSLIQIASQSASQRQRCWRAKAQLQPCISRP